MGAAIRHLGRWARAGALARALAWPQAAVAEAPAAAPLRVAFSIDTSEVGEEGPVIRRRIDERGALVLRELEVLPARSEEDPRLIATIHQDPADPFNYTYVLALVDARGDTRLETRGECKQCTEGALTERVIEAVRTTIVRLRQLDAPEEPPSTRPEGPEPPPSVVPEPAPEPAGLGPKGKAGVGLTIVGVLAAGTGLGLTLNPSRVDPDMPLHRIETQTPGVAILSAGAAVLITGVVLLVLDRPGRRHRRQATALDQGRRVQAARAPTKGGSP
ncbi:MAG: hypothetical protein R3B09_01175 [Nannocystaceae bacterium]